MNKKIIFIIIISTAILIGLIFLLSYYNTGYLTISTTPKYTTVSIDEKTIRTPEKKQRVKSGKHIVKASALGYLEEISTININPRESKSVKFELKKDISEFLPENNSRFKIEQIRKDSKVVYKITLYAIFNRPDQLDSYKAQLKSYRLEALKWLEDKGIDTKNQEFEWVPEEKYIPK